MKTSKSTLILLCHLLLSFQIMAQAYSSWKIIYNPALPLGELSDFMNNFSFRGINFGYQYSFNHNYSLGLSTGLINFRNVSNECNSKFQNKAAHSTKRYRKVNLLPVQLSGYYYLGKPEGISVYVGAGLGLYYINKTEEFGIYSSTKEKFQLGLAPITGIKFPLTRSFAFILETQLVSFNLDDLEMNFLKFYNSNPASYLGIMLGFQLN